LFQEICIAADHVSENNLYERGPLEHPMSEFVFMPSTKRPLIKFRSYIRCTKTLGGEGSAKKFAQT